MIRAQALSARAAPLMIRGVTFSLAAGTHALVGTPADGVALALAVIAGVRAPVAGHLQVLGAPAGHETIRRAVAYIPMVPRLPDALRVDEALATAAAIRGDALQPAEVRLGPFELAPLAQRRVASLSPSEARAVAIVEALSSQVVRVVLIDEPLIALDGRMAKLLGGALRARAEAGACVLVTTASLRDARDLADELVTFSQGAVVAEEASRIGAVRLRVVVDDARALVAALAGDADVLSLASRGDTVVAVGSSEPRVAAAIARAAGRAGVALREMRADTSPMERFP